MPKKLVSLNETTKAYLPYAIGLALLTGLVGYTVFARESPRPGKEIVIKAQQALALAEADLSDAKAAPKLPPLVDVWTQTDFYATHCGLTVVPLSGEYTAASGEYSGTAAHWRATISGSPLAVLACVNDLAQQLPVWPEHITASGEPVTGTASVVVAVLGSLPERAN